MLFESGKIEMKRKL